MTKNLLLIGDNLEDVFVHVEPKKLSAEAPILVYEQTSEPVVRPGGAGNIDALLHQLGNTTKFIYGWSVKGIDPLKPHLRVKQLPRKTRVLSQGVQIMRYDAYDTVGSPCAGCEMKRIDMDAFDGVVIADYQKGSIRDSGSITVVSAILSGRNYPSPIYIHTKGDPSAWLRQKLSPPPVFFANRDEYAQHLLAYDKAELVVRTLGPAGAELVRFGEAFYWLPSFVRSIDNVSGAGDAFMAGFVHEHLQSGVPQKALLVGSVAAALAVSRPYCGHINSPEEIYEYIDREIADATDSDTSGSVESLPEGSDDDETLG